VIGQEAEAPEVARKLGFQACKPSVRLSYAIVGGLPGLLIGRASLYLEARKSEVLVFQENIFVMLTKNFRNVLSVVQ
jgi:hypothetical protein